VIRRCREENAAGVARLLRETLENPWVVTERDILHWEQAPPRARRAAWVALDGAEIVGWAQAELRWEVSEKGAAELWVAVAKRHRGRGIGSGLFDAAWEHVGEIGGRTVQSWAEVDAGKRFLQRRGFHEVRQERISALDPREVDLSPRAVPKGFDVVPLSAVLDRPQELFAVYMAGEADMPSVFPEDNIAFEEWERGTLGSPSIDRDGSFVVLSGDQPVAIALLEVDREGKRATNEMTATLPGFRRRGLARLAKLASLRWAADFGVTSVLTSNDRENPAMLALNDALGYEPLVMRGVFVRELTDRD
jgi:GNAT superfamily N-acetyltransferase